MESIQHYSKCPELHSYHVIWSDNENDPPVFNETMQKLPVKVIFHRFKENTLNNRFFPPKVTPISRDYLWDHYGIETEAILSIDDDIIIDCEELSLSFRTWKQNK
jgi:hypothetical protein